MKTKNKSLGGARGAKRCAPARVRRQRDDRINFNGKPALTQGVANQGALEGKVSLNAKVLERATAADRIMRAFWRGPIWTCDINADQAPASVLDLGCDAFSG